MNDHGDTQDQPPAISLQMADVWLQTLVRLTNEADLHLPLTLSFGGTLVSGHTASEREYFESFGNEVEKEFRNTQLGPIARDLADLVRQLAEPGADEPETKPMVIHLKNARFLQSSGALVNREGVWWRGRLDAVEGFSFGLLS
jgi:hypothetical protein